MSEEIKGFEKEKKKLIELVFEKAKRDSKQTSKYPLARHIEEMTDAELKEKTLVRGFDRYILGDDSQPALSHYNLNNAAKYLGYENFGDFCRNYFPEMEPEQKFTEPEGRNEINIPNNKKSKL